MKSVCQFQQKTPVTGTYCMVGHIVEKFVASIQLKTKKYIRNTEIKRQYFVGCASVDTKTLISRRSN